MSANEKKLKTLQKEIMSTVKGFKQTLLKSSRLVYEKVFRRQRLKDSGLNNNLSIVGVDTFFHQKIIHGHIRNDVFMYSAYPETSRISNTSDNYIGVDSSFHRKIIHGHMKEDVLCTMQSGDSVIRPIIIVSN